MIRWRTEIRPSPIHGLGMFACEPIPAGAVVKDFHRLFDFTITDREFAELPACVQDWLETYCYVDKEGQYHYAGDNAKYTNHSDDANTRHVDDGRRSIAVRDIEAGEEITCDYRLFSFDKDTEQFR